MGFAARFGLLCAVALGTLGANRNDSDVVQPARADARCRGPRLADSFCLGLSSHARRRAERRLERQRGLTHHRSALHRRALQRHLFRRPASLFDQHERNDAGPIARARALSALAAHRRIARSSSRPRSSRTAAKSGAPAPGRSTEKPYRTIVVGDVNAVPLRLYVDPQTALIRLARELGGSETFEYRAYRRVGVFTLPFEVLHDGQIFERYDDRAPVSSRLAAPARTAPLL